MKVDINSFKIGIRALRTYETVFGRGADLIADFYDGKNLWDIIAVCKVPSTLDSYNAYIESDEFDSLLPHVNEITKKLIADTQVKKE